LNIEIDKLSAENQQLAGYIDELTAYEDELEIRKEKLKPRTVSKGKQENYIYMIYKDNVPPKTGFTTLHLVRRNRSTWYLNHQEIYESDRRLFYRDGLPNAMSANEDVKDLIRDLHSKELNVTAHFIDVETKKIPMIIAEVTEYFDYLHDE
jgi:hypothetical protein